MGTRLLGECDFPTASGAGRSMAAGGWVDANEYRRLLRRSGN
jgi:hypothetical protein